MRTTLDIGDDVLERARAIAREQGRSLGDVVTECARRGLPQPEDDLLKRFPMFPVPPDAKKFGLEDVQRALADEDW